MKPEIIYPDKKLFTKQIYILLTFTSFLFLFALFFQLLLPLGKVSFGRVAIVVWPIFLGVNFLIYGITLPLSKLWINNLKYTVEDERLRLNKGIISKIEQTIPFKAVTDFQLHRSLYDRFLGIASIKVQTAGQTQSPTGYEAVFAGLSEWETLIEDLREKIMVAQRGGSLAQTVAGSDEVSKVNDMSVLVEEVKKIRELLEKK